MRRFFLPLTVLLLLATIASAQTQYGYVKTKGRTVNGDYIPGEGLPGAFVSIKDLTPVVVKSHDGGFGFPVPRDLKYQIVSVEKKEYQLLDLSELRPKTYSGDTVYLVMVKPDQQEADLLAKERNLRRSSEKRLQRLEDSIQSLNISLVEKNQRLQEIDQERELNEKYIKELAKYYATIDYDRISSTQRQIDSLMEIGEFKKARQLLRTKGSVVGRLEKIQNEEIAEAQMDVDIQVAIETNNKAKSGTLEEKQELAQDCYSYFNSHLLEQCYDSASYYIEFRANIDSTNARWQYDAASYFRDQCINEKAEAYFLKALNGYQKQYDENKLKIGTIKNDLGRIYENQERYEESRAILDEALDIFIQLDSSYVEDGIDINKETGVIMTYVNMASVCFLEDTTWNKADSIMVEALGLLKKNQNEEMQSLMPLLLAYLGDVHYRRGQEFESLINTSIETAREWAENDTNYYELLGAVLVLSSFSYVHGYVRSDDMELLAIAEPMALESLEAYRLYEFYSKDEMELEKANVKQCLAYIYLYSKRFQESELQFVEALEVFRKNAKLKPLKYNEQLCNILMGLALAYRGLDQYDKSETLLKEVLELPYLVQTDNVARAQTEIAELKYIQNQPYEAIPYYYDAIRTLKCMVDEEENCQEYADRLAKTWLDLGEVYSSLQQLDSSILAYNEAASINRRLAQSDSQEYRYKLAVILGVLGDQYKSAEQYAESENAYLEAVGIYRRLSEDAPQIYEEAFVDLLVELGNFYHSIGQFSKAESAYREAIGVYQRRGDDINHANMLYNLGLLYSHSNRTAESIDAYNMALEIYRHLADRNQGLYENELVVTLNNLGVLYWRNKDTYSESKTVLEESLCICRRMKEKDGQANHSLLAMVLNNCGLL